MVEELISTSNVKMAFDSAGAFFSIVENIAFSIDKSMEGRLHPSEVMKVASDALMMVFKTMSEDISNPDCIKHLTALLVTKSGLSKMIDPKFMGAESPKDIH